MELPLAHDTLGDVLTGTDSSEKCAVRAELRDSAAIHPVAGRAIGGEHPVAEAPILSARLDEIPELIRDPISILRVDVIEPSRQCAGEAARWISHECVDVAIQLQLIRFVVCLLDDIRSVPGGDPKALLAFK